MQKAEDGNGQSKMRLWIGPSREARGKGGRGLAERFAVTGKPRFTEQKIHAQDNQTSVKQNLHDCYSSRATVALSFFPSLLLFALRSPVRLSFSTPTSRYSRDNV